MFTGIVERTGTVANVRPTEGGRKLTIDAGGVADDARPGASICVDGVCLTITAIDGQRLTFDVIKETLDKSTLGRKRTGDRVNLERSLRPDSRIDGHFVQGHVDGTADVIRVESSAGEHLAWMRPQSHLRPYIVPKGSVCIDGVSLTIAAVTGDTFSVALIPTTLECTTFSELSAGRQVNIETDIITRTVVHRLQEMSAGGGLTLQKLHETGFA